MPTVEEIRSVQLENAEADERFWHRVHRTLVRCIPASLVVNPRRSASACTQRNLGSHRLWADDAIIIAPPLRGAIVSRRKFIEPRIFYNYTRRHRSRLVTDPRLGGEACTLWNCCTATMSPRRSSA